MTSNSIPPSKKKFLEEHVDLWNRIGREYSHWAKTGHAYHKRLRQVYQAHIPAGQSVLEIGCGRGDLLASVQPSCGVGLDLSGEMIRLAREAHPQLKFIEANAEDFTPTQTFDFIILSDLLNDIWDAQALLENILQWSTPQTRLILNVYSRVWEPFMSLAVRMGLAKPYQQQNWFTLPDVENLLNLSGFEVVRTWREFIFPFDIPLLYGFFNRYIARLGLFNWLDLANFMVARKKGLPLAEDKKPVVSIVIPTRNEAGNIAELLARTPDLGRGSEILFVDGHSSDNTVEVIEREIKVHPERNCQLFEQTGKGKGDAVRLGFAKAKGDILMILDADISVPPEDLVRFYNALVCGTGDFINGVRLVYPMEKQAMRFFNLLGNKFFGLTFSWLLGQRVKDTLCGTKVLWKRDYERIAANRAVFGDFDPFGDFDLLFGAARLNLKIVDLPIRYHERTYGTTNISRWKNGWMLLRMSTFAAKKLKFY
jgi:SAM-dependent methyltransferase